MDRIWLAQYPQGVPAEVAPGPHKTLRDVFQDSCRRFRNRPAFASMGTSLSYGELDRLAAQFGAFLQRQPGLGKGARVAIMLPNLLQTSAWVGGVLHEGCEIVVTPLPLYYHVFSLTANCLLFVKWGGENHLITNPRNIAGLIREIRRLRFTAITGVNTLFNALLDAGDMALVDARGWVQLIDRKKDLIIVSGFKVYPNEIEEVATLHVLEAGAIGVPDARSGEAVKLIVVPRDASLTEAALIEHCRQHLAGYKVPRHVALRTTPLPRTPIGKVLRRALRDQAAAGQAAKAA